MQEVTVLRYQDQDLEAVKRDGQIWLRVRQIVSPLGYASEGNVIRLFNRHSDEFGPDETVLLTVETAGGPQEVRFFSLRGARLLAILAGTPEGKEFRRWVMDLLEGKVRQRSLSKPLVPLSPDGKRALEFAMGLVGPEHPAHGELHAVFTGELDIPESPAMEDWVNAWIMASAELAKANAEFSRIKNLARWEGYSEDDIKAAVRRKRIRDAAGPELPFEGGADA